MSLRGFLCIVAFSDACCWAAWWLLLSMTAPDAGLMIVALFYASLLLALVGLFVVVGFAIRVFILKRDEVVHLYVKRTFRQAFLLGLLLIIALWLAHHTWLRWWVLSVVVAALGMWEHFFLTGEESY